jgi:hypothetical protein
MPSENKITAKQAKCFNTSRYSTNRRSGPPDHNEDVSTTDDYFPAPLSTDGDRSKHKKERQREEDKETRRRGDEMRQSPCPLVFSSHCQTRPANVKYARSDR